MSTTMETKHPTCKEQVREAYHSRIVDLRELMAADREGRKSDEGSLAEYGLCFDYVGPGTFRNQRRGYFRYQLSWGGPSEEFRFYLDERRKPYKVEFWFLDWWDGAHITFREGKEFAFLCDVFEWFASCLEVEEMIRAGEARGER